MENHTQSYMYRAVVVVSLFGLMAFLFWALGDAKTPLLFSFVFAYLSFPFIARLEKWGVPRSAAVVVFVLLSFVLIFVLSVAILPGLYNELNDLIRSFPQFLKVSIQKLDAYLETKGIDIGWEQGKIKEAVRQGVKSRSDDLVNFAIASIAKTFSSVTGFVLAILNLVLIPVFFFFVITDYERISGFFKSLIPPSWENSINRYVKLSNNILSGFFRGQISVAALLAIFYAIGLKLVGLKYGVLIGLISGIISIIPYAGLYLGLGAALVVSVAHDGGTAQLGLIVLVFILVQTLEGFVITPKLVGGNVGLNAFETILSLIIWGNILGFAGLIAGVPLTAILKYLFIEIYNEYKHEVITSNSQSS